MADTTNSYDSAVHAVHVNDSMHRTMAHIWRASKCAVYGLLYIGSESARTTGNTYTTFLGKPCATWFLDATGRAMSMWQCGPCDDSMARTNRLGGRLPANERMTAYKKKGFWACDRLDGCAE